MNSLSPKTLSSGKKFLFDHVHDHTHNTLDMPAFSQRQVNEVKEQALQEGYQKGLEEAHATIEKHVYNSMGVLKEHLVHLQETQEALVHTMHGYVAHMCQVMAHKIYPVLAEKQVFQEVEALLEKAFQSLDRQVCLRVVVAPQAQEATINALQKLKENYQWTGETQVQTDSTLPPGDVQIHWEGGGIERYTQDLLDQLNSLLSQLSPTQGSSEEQSAPVDEGEKIYG
jgi:flagellar biosynthesis/type III secretory pathway protein FliH